MISVFGAMAAAFRRDRRGVAAVEFAFIAPILLAMYFLTMEFSQAIETNKKLSRVASMVGDLVTQQDEITTTELDAIMQIGDSTLLPYHRSTPTIAITGISIDGSTPPNVTVEWSRKLEGGTFSAGAAADTATTVPDDLKVSNSFIVRVESDLDYRPVLTWSASSKEGLGLASAFSSIAMSETYYLRPRMSNLVDCTNC